ncbi:glycosyltransferase family 4 protein [Urechidicola sp. KH5]
MKVLIITYYWPPAGGSGVQRWLKFVKYFQEFGITPVVYCPYNASYELMDATLKAEIPEGIEIIQQSIIEPNSFLKSKKVATATIGQSKSPLKKIMTYIRGNYFIPDARALWIKPSVKFLKNYLNQNPVDAIISTGPPHSTHLIGLKLKRAIGVKWIADFRDPMSKLFYNKDLQIGDKALKRIKSLENQILQEADKVVVVSNHMKEAFQSQTNKVKVVTNGFDLELADDGPIRNYKFSIAHIGLFPHQSNPVILWESLNDLIVAKDINHEDLQIELTGTVSQEVIESIQSFGLQKVLKLKAAVSHDKAVSLQRQAQILLLCIPNTEDSEGIVTGKIFEYITSKRPILAFAPKNGDAAKIINNTQTGTVVSYNDIDQLKTVLLHYYKAFKSQSLLVEPKQIEQYHRKVLTEQMATILKSL